MTMKKVLVVADHREDASALCDRVRELGHVAGGTFNEDGAIIAAQVLRPDIVVLDVARTDEDGYGIARAIRRQAGMEDCRIIAVSSDPSTEHRAQALRSECEALYAKPLNPAVLEDLLGNPSHVH